MNEDAVRVLIQTHISRYTEMHFLDVYKLLHQATFGPSHAIISRESARDWLQHELDTNPPESGQPLLESISEDDSLVRLHLRPYKAGQGEVEALLDAMEHSSERMTGDMALMQDRWTVFEDMVGFDRGLMARFPPREMGLFRTVYAAQGWPTVQHSPAYLKAYRPAYRVLTLEDARVLCAQHDLEFIL